MDRFTWKAPDGTYQIDDCMAVHKTLCYDENFKNPFDIYEGKAIDKLGKYEDAEEQGLLVKLPCKVGDTLYQVISSVEEYKITAIGIYENKLVICTDNLKTGIGFSFDANRIGKRYFITKEEAEAALERMMGG